MHPWLALGLLAAVAFFAWAWTRSLRRGWYPRHVIGLAGLTIIALCVAVGYGGFRYDTTHVSSGEPE